MEKTIVALCLILMLGTAIVVPVSVAAVNGNLDFVVTENGTAERTEIAKFNVVELLNSEKINVTYDMSRSVKDGFADIYKDSNGNDYIYKNGKLTGFYSEV